MSIRDYNSCKESSPEALHFYYEKLYPLKLLFRWLSYGDPHYFLKREIAFITLEDKYIRYNSYSNESQFKSHLLEKIPAKVDIGAIYCVPPRDFPIASVCNPLEKELVFDIDITDYNDVRTCCKTAEICNKCWKFMCLACKILERVLREDFGFRHILWVYSGCRGIHCWVGDKDARRLSNRERSSIFEYINLVQGNRNVLRRVQLSTMHLHNSVQKALDIIVENFIEFIIAEQNILGNDNDGLNKFLGLLRDCRQNEFGQIMSKYNTSKERWHAFETHLDFLQKRNLLPSKFKHLKEEIMLHFAYPRLDGIVTQNLSHLLKSPFCIHPKTGRICIPFRAATVDHFNVNEVPTLYYALDQLNKHYQRIFLDGDLQAYESKDDFQGKNLMNTCLSEPYNVLQEFVNGLEGSSIDTF